MKVRNVSGRARSVSPAGDGPIVHAPADESVEVPDTVAASLLEQPKNWAPAGPTSVDASVKAVLAQVGDNPGRAHTALEAERSSDNPRSTLVDALTKIIESEED